MAYFFLRASLLVRESGLLGLIATNTLAQGDTREVGLDQLVSRGVQIYRAIQSRPWPSASAGVSYAAAWLSLAPLGGDAEFVADGVPCRGISTVLEPAGRNVGNPVRLQGNADIAFIGCYPLGSGFVIDSSLMERWVEADPRNSEVIALYLTGDDLNGSPSISTDKWIIDFNDRSEEAASEYELPFRHVERFVKPERSRNADKSRRTYWWRFTRTAPGLRAAIARNDNIICIRQTSNTLMPVRISNRFIYDQTMTVMAEDSFSFLASVSSSPHVMWVIQRGVTLVVDLGIHLPTCSKPFRDRRRPIGQGGPARCSTSSAVRLWRSAIWDLPSCTTLLTTPRLGTAPMWT